MSQSVILIAPSLFDTLYDRIAASLGDCAVYRHRGTMEQLAPEMLAGADVLVLPGQVACGRATMSLAPRLRALVSPISGTEGIDKQAATEFGIVVANGRMPENYESMAESTVLLILAALYDLRGAERVLRDNLPRPGAPTARMLRGRTLGMIGYGAIGRAVATRLAAWQVRILVACPRPPSDLPANAAMADLETLLRDSDVVSLHCALNDETRGMLTGDRLALMKPDVVFVNTARGGMYDEATLAELAVARPAMRLALDTFAEEPLPPDSPLRDVPHAILTPHAVGHTREVIAAIPGTAVANVRAALRGETPPYVVNPAVLPAWLDRWRGASLE